MSRKLYVSTKNFPKRNLPSGYTQVEYIQATGSQYVDTRYTPNQDTRIVADVELKLDGSNYFLFGARKSNSNNSADVSTYCFNAYQTKYRTHYYNGYSDFDTAVSYDTRFIIDKNKNVTTLNGEHVVTRTYTPFTSPCSMVIFAVNTSGTVGSFAKAKLYAFTIYENDTLIRDYVPCINPDGSPGLYDIVNGVFYGNAGTGIFSVGESQKSEVAMKATKIYVEEDGIAQFGRKAYIGIGGVARPFWGLDKATYFGQIDTAHRAFESLVASNSEYTIFAGGYNESVNNAITTGVAFNRAMTGVALPTPLTNGRVNGAAATAGDEYAVFCAGLGVSSGDATKTVDAYDTELTKHQLAQLGYKRYYLTGESFAGYAIFAGGRSDDTTDRAFVTSYDADLTQKTMTSMTKARSFLSSTQISEYLLIGGGLYDSYTLADDIDVYTNLMTKVTGLTLSGEKYGCIGVHTNSYAMFVSGVDEDGNNLKVVDAFDENLTRITVSGGEASSGEDAVYDAIGVSFKNCAIVTDGRCVDSYDDSLTVIKVCDFSNTRFGCSMGAIGNTVYITGGGTRYSESGLSSTTEIVKLS